MSIEHSPQRQRLRPRFSRIAAAVEYGGISRSRLYEWARQHLLDQARTLTAAQAGRPRGVDLRRAISTAYYAVFHAIASAAADSVVPADKRTTEQYARVYRSVNHGPLRKLCESVRGKNSNFGDDIRRFAAAVADLQEKRHSADYDPLFKAIRSDAILTIAAAGSAITQFENAPVDERAHFLSLLLFPPK